MKILLANGCSHTAGVDIDPNKLYRCPEKSWPKWVADHYNWQYNNIAMGGAGNEQISRSTIVAIGNMIEIEKQDPKNIVVAICWSGFNRYEYWHKEDQKHKSFSLNITKSPYTPDEIYLKYIEARSMVEPEDYANYKNLYYIHTLAKVLESYGVEYYFANCLQTFTLPKDFKGSSNLRSEYFNLLELYGSRIERHLGFFNKHKTFFQQLQGTPKSPHGLGMHWGEEGQKKYAEFFIQHMKEHGGLAHLGEH